MKKVNILGTEYTIEIKKREDDKFLMDKCDGYCDKTTKKIVVLEEPKDNELENFSDYQKKVIRHEIVHAFLFESGLHECINHSDGHDEQIVDWIAAQFPKMLKVFQEAECI